MRNKNFLEAHALEMKQHSREGNQFCFYKHLKSLDLEGTRRCSSQFIRDETGKLLRDPQEILQRWKRHFESLLNVAPTSSTRQL